MSGLSRPPPCCTSTNGPTRTKCTAFALGYFSSYPLLLRLVAEAWSMERCLHLHTHTHLEPRCTFRSFHGRSFSHAALHHAGPGDGGRPRRSGRAASRAPRRLRGRHGRALLSLAGHTQGWPTALSGSPLPGGRESARVFAIGFILDPLLVASFYHFWQQALGERAKRGVQKWSNVAPKAPRAPRAPRAVFYWRSLSKDLQ